MTTDPRVSVVLPTFERREYVCRAVRSVFAQRYSSWELIVVDDGSTDGTREALRAFDPRLRYVWQENRGVSAARNAALRLARGEFVAFLDSDDRWLPDHLDTMVAMLDRNPEAVLASTSPRFDLGGRKRLEDAIAVDTLPLQLVDNWIGHPSAMALRRADVLAVDGFDERMEVQEDAELWLRLAARGPFAFLERRTVVKQHTRGSLSERGKRGGRYLASGEQMARSAKEVVGKVQRPDGSALADRAEGRAHYAAALRALAEQDDERVRLELAEACLRLPELSSDPGFLDFRLKMVATDRRLRQHHYETAARLWPDPRSDTAIFLQLRAILLALRLRRFRHTHVLVSSLRLRAVPGLLARQHRLGRRLLRSRLQSHLYRGRDAPRKPS